MEDKIDEDHLKQKGLREQGASSTILLSVDRYYFSLIRSDTNCRQEFG